MHVLFRTTMFVLAGLLLTACAADGRDGDSIAERSGTYTGQRAYDSVGDLMRAKVQRHDGILAALVHGNFERIEHNADELVRLSEQGDWMVHDTKAYIGFSDQFQEAATDLALSARERDLDAATDDYMRVLHSCIACHNYLRREQLSKDMPGAVSRVNAFEQPRDVRDRRESY